MGLSFGEPPRVLRYSIWVKASALVLALAPVAATALPLAYQDGLQPEIRLALALMTVTFGGIGALLLLELFRVRHTLDDQGLDYRTPWTQHRTLRWAEVTQVKWSFAYQLFIQDVHGRQ